MSASLVRAAGWFAVAVVFAVGGFVLPEFYVTLLNYIGLYSLVALGLVLLTGASGITSFGQAAFVGIGAYTTAVLSTHAGLSPWLGLAAGLGITLIVSVILGLLTLRLSGHYLPLGTICWSVSLYYIFGNIQAFGGQTGMMGIPPIELFGLTFDTGRRMYFLIWIFTLAALLVSDNVLHSRAGRAMRALKNNAQTAENFGVNGGAMRLWVFVYAALLAGLSGWLYAHLLRFVNPSPFGIAMSIEYLFMAVVGGAGHVWGAVLGSAVITILREFLQDAMPGILGRTGNFEIIFFGALIILLLQINRDRGFGALFDLYKRRPPSPSDHGLPAVARRSGDQPLLSVRGVSRRFGGLVAVDNVSFDVARGRIVALIGPNGAGKSTLFNLVTGLLALDAGEVWSNGSRIDRLRPHQIVGRGLARSYQHVVLVQSASVLENVMFGAYHRTRRGPLAAGLGIGGEEEHLTVTEAERQIRRVGLEKWMNEPAGNLALGQQRLVEIARALCAGPELLLLDEPAAGLRHAEKAELATLLRELRASGTSVLLVEHDMRFVMGVADEIVVLNFGCKLAHGSPTEIRRDPRVLEAYLGGSVK
ncbi:MAG: branched-chain amino acid ABC transporter ATP-binding protein/permease [Alphaproteobacteria bacterium]|nr:branched-chain amino acid ABC transporter ATP-binding protein/permease [Alphaproteobacteria bacterium]